MAGLRDIQAGTVIGAYQVVSEIGSGSEGYVFLADDLERKRLVALKLVDEIEFPNITEAFEANALEDPGICRIYRTGTWQGLGYIAMGVVDGESLQALFDRHPQDEDPALFLTILRHVADTLVHAHEAGLCHGSLRPSSILIRNSGWPVVLDFGMRGEGLDRDRLFALDRLCFARLVRMSAERCDPDLVPEWLNDVFERCRARSEEELPRTMREFRDALEEPHPEEDDDALHIGEFISSHRRHLKVGGGIVAAALLVVLLMGLGSSPSMFFGPAPSKAEPRAPRPAPRARKIDAQDIEKAEKRWEYVKRGRLTLDQIDEKTRDVQRSLLQAPDDEGLRLRLAKLQLEAVRWFSDQSDGEKARSYLKQAKQLLSSLPRKQVHWEEVTRHEGVARLLEGRVLAAEGNIEAARSVFSDGLRLFRGRKLDPEAQKVFDDLAGELRAARTR